jgi:hypothetical protein
LTEALDILLSFDDEDGASLCHGLHQLHEPIGNAPHVAERPNPAAIAIRSTLTKALGRVAHNLEQQLFGLGAVVICSDDCKFPPSLALMMAAVSSSCAAITSVFMSFLLMRTEYIASSQKVHGQVGINCDIHILR